MVEAIVEHDYQAKQPDELTIKKGDVIKEVVKKQDGWCEGLLDGKRGLFPDNFVALIQVSMRGNAPNIRKCRAVYSYKQEHEDELNLTVGDFIEVVGEEEEGWWRGKLNGKLGVFPSNFVEEIAKEAKVKEEIKEEPREKDDVKEQVAASTKIFCEVKYSYTAQNVDELSLKEGDIVTLISKDGQDAGWWRGELNGKMGVFPDNFVAIIEVDAEKIANTMTTPMLRTPTHVQQPQRRTQSQEIKKVEATPPIPSKKPAFGGKKSPSLSGGLISSFKKIVDTIDGSTSSKSVQINNLDLEKDKEPEEKYHAFDQVERNSILPDLRATRVKAPGRRPPSVALKDGEAPNINGNSDYGSLEDNNGEIVNNGDIAANIAVEIKPRSLECQKPPWLDEMKKNMKRPLPEKKPDEEATSFEINANMSKSMPSMVLQPQPARVNKPPTPTPTPTPPPSSEKAENTRMPKTPPNELEKPERVTLRPKPVVNARPTSIESPPKPMVKTPTPSPTVKTPSSPSTIKPPIADRSSFEMSSRHYNELNEKIHVLEAEMHRQRDEFRNALEELRGRLQVETDMRMLLQVELEKLQTQV